MIAVSVTSKKEYFDILAKATVSTDQSLARQATREIITICSQAEGCDYLVLLRKEIDGKIFFGRNLCSTLEAAEKLKQEILAKGED